MLEFKNIKDDIFHLKDKVDIIVYRTNTKVAKMEPSNYTGSSYQYILPDIVLNEDNAIEYLSYYKRAVYAAIEKRLRSVAIEVIDCHDDDLSWSVALELKKVLESALKFSSIKIIFVCKNKRMKEIYDLAMFGESREITIDLTDDLNFNNVILVPTKEKLSKFDKSCKKLKRSERFKVFFTLKWKTLSLGQYQLIEGENNCDYYFLVNLIKPSITFIKDFKGVVLQGIQTVLSSMDMIQQKNITIPIIYFTKNKKENREIVKELVKIVCETAERKEINVQFYCKYEELYDLVSKILSERGGNNL